MAELQREEISKRIKQAREEAGLSQNELGDALNVHWRTIQNYESVRVPFRLLGQIADITGKSLEWLLHGDTPDVMSTLNRNSNLEARLTQIEAGLGKQFQFLLALAQALGMKVPEPAPDPAQAVAGLVQWLEQAAPELAAAQREAQNPAAAEGPSRKQR